MSAKKLAQIRDQITALVDERAEVESAPVPREEAVANIAALIGARRVAGPVEELTAAATAVENASYAPGSLDPVATRRDEIGHLAQVFDRMAREVRAREQRLQREIKQLSVQIDESKRRRQVAEITETDYFRDLQRRAKDLRGRGDGEGS